MKKIISIIFMSLLLISCKNKEEVTNSNTSNEKTTIFAMHLGKIINPEYPVFKKAAEITGIELENVASENQTDEIAAFNLMLTLNPLPDIIAYGLPTELENLGIEGGLIPLEDLIKEHSPNIQKFFDENPGYRKDATSVNGHIYVIPSYYDYYNLKVSIASFIRKDWLEKLNLKSPKNVEELHNVLVAFKEKDPNGNGIKDEVPLFIRAYDTRSILLPLLDIFKSSASWREKNGKIIYNPSQENFKFAIKELAKWYKEGLIDKELFTRGMKSRDYMLGNNLGGFTMDWVASTSSYNSKLNDKIPGFNFSAILPLEFNGDYKTYIARPRYDGGWSISKDAKDPIKLIKYFDFWFSEKGRRLWNFGIEGEDYTIVNNKPVFTDKILKSDKTPLQVLREQGAQARIGAWQDFNYEYAWATPEAIKINELYMKNDVVVDLLPELKYSKENSKKINKINSNMRSYVEEKIQGWILGTSNIEKDWEEYLNRLNELGLEEATKINNEAWINFNK
ncbi:type 2 periplasmic-binding domain-containing protein [Oceanivirga salmonicida]|uniref:extracellular solute-binding protein n=1 Tax=Oceanivirga salmonicida TaxID=1769291 RepID=UPI0012E0FD5D|nr:extracellular solute-binding protein [Oceanivirga salmonicida]